MLAVRLIAIMLRKIITFQKVYNAVSVEGTTKWQRIQK